MLPKTIPGQALIIVEPTGRDGLASYVVMSHLLNTMLRQGALRLWLIALTCWGWSGV